MTKYFVDPDGKYIGGYDGAEPPADAIEVPSAPDDARQIWNFVTATWGPIPPLTDYTIQADVPWTRMTDNEAELMQDEIDSSPAKTRNMINKATSFTTGTDAFVKFKVIIVAALDQSRADAIMGPPMAFKLSSDES